MTGFPSHNHADHVLVASPSSVVRQRVLDSLASRARRVEEARGGAEALLQLEKGFWQTLVLDRRLPDLDAEELSRTVRERYPAVEVVLVGNEKEASADPVSGATLGEESHVELDAAANGRAPDRTPSKDPCNSHLPEGQVEQFAANGGAAEEALPGMIGRSAKMQAVYRKARLVAPRDTTVLISGPTGCGKELVARALHDLSPRAARAFAVVNCAAIPETLLEAELFGYTRGAFTGAFQSYSGRIHAAHQGTLFLDEIGDLPLGLQPKLLRFLEQREMQRLGSLQTVRVDVRVISATNVDLLTLVQEGKFREDLYYRLSVFPLVIPALRERPGDISDLAQHFLARFSQDSPEASFSAEALGLLRSARWPGNVRELQNVIERSVILASGKAIIHPEHLMFGGASNIPGERLGLQR
ncbi:MAG TPA: sigma-54 dependent transcriptional regulator [Terriglobales bacterium]|nr:sigma-54 dependent transcriptional regulator [Terriglobales bacterium]